ncbi:phage tail fiber domain-containing protein [Mangrovicoccus algicola]|uniref:Right-handed parallel beta-helix repeat-containing protein n=1 Tax=Mangrovicoccus algicola TaxID=2771008 RepID=A0A8J7CW55_9RHOB|nr:phage tail fiber protein [Mangrovicoccus algicola]MBE3637362.1 hypothetical protein [Mangrovicoccus algicola]
MAETIYPRSATYVVGSTASAGPFEIPFPFADEDEVAVHVNGVRITAYSVTVASRYGTEGNKVTLEAPVSNAGVVVSSSVLPARAIGDTFTQQELSRELDRLFYLSQEAAERAVSVDPGSGVADIGSGRIRTSADPVEAQDLVTLGYAERVLSGDAASALQIEAGVILGHPWRYERDEAAPPAASYLDTAGRRYRLLNDEIGLRYFDRTLRDGGQIGTALLGFIDYARETGRAAAVIPPGLYELEQAIAASLDGDGTSGVQISLRGAGRRATGLWCDAASVPGTAISLQSGHRLSSFELGGFSLGYRGTQEAGSWALDLGAAGGAGQNHRSLVLDGLDLAPFEFLTGQADGTVQSSWANMIRADGHLNALLREVRLQGVDAPAADWSDDGPMWATLVGVQLDDCAGADLLKVSAAGIGTAIRSHGTASGGRLAMDGCDLRAVRTGLSWLRLGAQADLRVTGCRIQHRDAGLVFDGAGLADVSGNTFRQEAADADYADRVIPVDVLAQNVTSMTAQGNTHAGTGDPRRIGLRVSGAGGQARVTGGTIPAGAVLASWLDIPADAGLTQFDLPATAEGAEPALFIANPDAAPVRRIGGAMLEISLLESTDYDTIQHGAWVTISFETHDGHPFLDGAFGPEGVTVPDGLGVTRARAVANVEFDTNSSGNRGLAINLNGSTRLTGAQSTANGVANRPTSLSVQTPWFDVTPGDVISVQVVQTTGSALAISSPTNMSVEFI